MNIDYFKNKIFLILSFLAILSFFLGFVFKENSAGAGGLTGDFQNTWLNLNTFINYNLTMALDFVKSGSREYYISSRTPVLYILNSILNPFTSSIDSFIKSVFVFSVFGYLAFYKLLIEINKNSEKFLILLLSCCLLLSPYYRTSAFWGAEENYGLFSTILSLLFYNRVNYTENKINLFFSIFFSSLSVYLDQKLIIVPLLIFLDIYFFNKNKMKIKLFTIFNYIIFSFPYIYFIISWKNIVPPGDAAGRGVGSKIFLYHPVYLSTILAFYIFPLIFFKKNLLLNFKLFLVNKFNITLLIIYTLYIIFLFNFHDINSEPFIGKGIIHKFSYKFIENNLIKQLFVYSVSFCSFGLILLFIEKKLIKGLLIIYFYLMSIFTYPLQQEYLDPIVLIIFFGLVEKNLDINKINCSFLFFYLTLFLIVANIYYNSIL